MLERVHENPFKFIDREVLLTIVPVNEAALTLSAFPNGYFTCDLNPFENYALAKHLCDKYHYQLFGIGASLIGFKRITDLNDASVRFLGEDLANLYNQGQTESVIERFSSIVKENEYLFLKYVEYLEL